MHRTRYHRLFSGVLYFSFLFVVLSIGLPLQAQQKTTRILFILDGSGSMAARWEGVRKFDIAKDLLYNVLDTLQMKNPNVEIGMRVFGFQTPYTLHNCKDSKLVVPFATGNAPEIQAALNHITVQGQSPIAYSLIEGIKDFPRDPDARNAIVLITDGLETCNGDPCALQELLLKRNIALRPFVVGLGMDKEQASAFDCLGKFYDATNKRSFRTALNVVITQAMRATTAQVNLLDALERPTKTNVEMTFYNARTGEIEYMLIHAIGYYGEPDTMYLSPVIDYDLKVHTVPPVYKRGISLTPGRHNIIAVGIPQGRLVLKIEGYPQYSTIRCLVRKSGSNELVAVQGLNTRKQYLTGFYDLEILTLPRVIKKQIEIKPGEETVITIAETGKVFIRPSRTGIISIYQLDHGSITKIFEDPLLNQYRTIKLQPGKYMAVFRQYKFQSAQLTKTQYFEIFSNRSVSLTF